MQRAQNGRRLRAAATSGSALLQALSTPGAPQGPDEAGLDRAQRPVAHGPGRGSGPSGSYCKFCYQNGQFTAVDVDMDEFIEATAQLEADALGITREEAVSLMATLLPHLERWKHA